MLNFVFSLKNANFLSLPCFLAVFRIIGSVPLTNNLAPDPALYTVTFRMPQKFIIFPSFSFITF
jgi:hypothetical protein